MPSLARNTGGVTMPWFGPGPCAQPYHGHAPGYTFWLWRALSTGIASQESLHHLWFWHGTAGCFSSWGETSPLPGFYIPSCVQDLRTMVFHCQDTGWLKTAPDHQLAPFSSPQTHLMEMNPTNQGARQSEVAYWHIACTTACGTTSFNFCGPLMRERASASRLEEPVLYTMSKLYCDSAATQRCPTASSFAVVRTYVRGLLSVKAVSRFL